MSVSQDLFDNAQAVSLDHLDLSACLDVDSILERIDSEKTQDLNPTSFGHPGEDDLLFRIRLTIENCVMDDRVKESVDLVRSFAAKTKMGNSLNHFLRRAIVCTLYNHQNGKGLVRFQEAYRAFFDACLDRGIDVGHFHIFLESAFNTFRTYVRHNPFRNPNDGFKFKGPKFPFMVRG